MHSQPRRVFLDCALTQDQNGELGVPRASLPGPYDADAPYEVFAVAKDPVEGGFNNQTRHTQGLENK